MLTAKLRWVNSWLGCFASRRLVALSLTTAICAALHAAVPVHRYKPLTTRVLRAGTDGSQPTDFGVKIGDAVTGGVQSLFSTGFTTSSNNAGFQVITLGRDSTYNTAAESNVSYPTDTPEDTYGFTESASAQIATHCSIPNGCIVIIQSLGKIGYTGCNQFGAYSSVNYLCAQTAAFFLQVGAVAPVAYADGNSESVAYSFIGNCYESNCSSTSTLGANHERLTCSSSSNSDCVGITTASSFGYTLESTAPPGSTPNQIGNLSGALVRDNHGTGYWTYVSTAPRISFSITANENSLGNSIKFVTGSDPTIVSGKTVYWNTDPPDPTYTTWESDSRPLNPGATAGFHMLVIDASPWKGAPNVILDKTYTFLYDPTDFSGSNLQDMPGDITSNCTSRRCLFFISTVGMITQQLRASTYAYGPLTVSDILDGVAMALRSIGADYRTFEQLGLKPTTTPAQHGGATAEPDDYVFVGQHVQSPSGFFISPIATVPSSTAEFSTFISRQIYTYPPAQSNVAGYLKMDRQGYYEPSNATLYAGFSDPLADLLASAEVQPNAYWPLSGPTDSTPGLLAAYKYVSQHTAGTSDMRSEYAEFPATWGNWQGSVERVTYTQNPNYSASDLAAVKKEILGELRALKTLAKFSGALSYFFTESSTEGLGYLLAISDSLTADLQIDQTKTTTTPSWLHIFNDVIAISGPVSGAASLIPGGGPVGVVAQTGIAVLGLVVDQNAESSNDPHGTPLQATEQVEIAASSVGSSIVTNYNRYIDGNARMVQRIASDPNRLNHFYAAEVILARDQADPTNPSTLLQALTEYDLASRREIYTKLIASSYQILHYQYAGPDSNVDDAISYYNISITPKISRFYGDRCNISNVIADLNSTTSFLPGTLIDGRYSAYTPYGRQDKSPHDLWWDFWGIGVSQNIHTDCPRVDDYENTDTNFVKYGLFQPINSSQGGGVKSPLGMYLPYFLNPERTGISLINGNTADPYWNCTYCNDLYAPIPPHTYPQHLDEVY